MSSGELRLKSVNTHLLRSVYCTHEDKWQQQVADNMIYVGISNTEDGPRQYEIARQVIVCTACGWVTDIRDVDRDET